MGDRDLVDSTDSFKSGLLLALCRTLEALGESSDLGPSAVDDDRFLVEAEATPPLVGSRGRRWSISSSSPMGSNCWWFSHVSTFIRLEALGGGMPLDSAIAIAEGLVVPLFFPGDGDEGASVIIGSEL